MSRLLLLLLACACALPAAAQTDALRVPYERFTLDNGLDVVLHRDPSTPFLTVNTWYHVGSAREKPGRTGFAHLFEHLMFEGSGNVPEGAIDAWIEEAGGSNNGSTTEDRTNYYVDAASNALDLALYLDADRMASLLDAMSPAAVDGQRDVVKNERRQSYENRPYGLAFPILGQYLYPKGHPYHWPVIGSMNDLSAAAYEDVVDFFRTYYVPNNASLVVAGDIDLDEARRLVEKWYGGIPRGPEPPPVVVAKASLDGETRLVHEDRVQLPRLYMAWHTPPAFAPGDAEMQVVAGVLAGGKNSRLYKRLVYDTEMAQNVSAFQNAGALGGVFYLMVTARPGVALSDIEQIVEEEIEKLQREAPTAREVAREINGIESSFLFGLERVVGFGGKADQLNGYLVQTGNPDYFAEDLARFHAFTPADLSAMAATYLRPDRRVVLSVVPQGQPEMALQGSVAAVNEY